MTPWIDVVEYDDAEGRLKSLYDKVKGPGNNVDNIMMMHSLRPHTMEAHMTIYKYVIHHSANTVPKWFLETLGVYVSHLNNCRYCVEHHFAGLTRLLDNEKLSTAIRAALETDQFDGVFSDQEAAALAYARALTKDVTDMPEQLVIDMRDTGYDDGEILEINQLVAYFAYANRTVIGLGCSTDGDILGLSPNDSADPDNWSHS
ncbi:MAG: peroxidase-related enzyme [Rhodospirillaceae bacterium]|mgnify:FL=1|jgi:uncharacterized peroxidase-related enzyme|nr:peroxidase-related enzyme [Rhodospirillaceae bacterium]